MSFLVLQNANIQLGAEVSRIENLGSSDSDPIIRVTVHRDGQEMPSEFDEVVVTIPLGCFKRNAVEFVPVVPTDITDAIKNASISSLEKVYIAFPKAFWDTQDNSNRIRQDGSFEQLRGTTNYFPGFADFLNPSYAPKEHHSWAFEVNPLSDPHVFGSNAMPVLLFTLFGESGHHLTSAIDSLSPSDPQYFYIADQFMRPYYSLLPGFDSADSNCSPCAVLATNWQNDNFAGNGSYTNFKVHDVQKQVALDDEVRAMRRGMPDRGIWLAGEHTAPFVGLGTSTGAYWSGESVAMRIIGINGFAQ